MKVVKVSDSIEKQVVIGLITSEEYTKMVLPILDLNLFDSVDCKFISSLCMDYYGKYGKVPGKDIGGIFEDKSTSLEPARKKRIKAFLATISNKYEEWGFNEVYILEKTEKYFRSQNLELQVRKISQLLEDDKLDEAEDIWVNGLRTGKYQDFGINPFEEEYVKDAFKKDDVRVSVGSGVENVDKIAGRVKAGWLACFMAPMKRGKTFALINVAIHALMDNLNVVFISFETEEFDNSMRLWQGIGSFVQEHDKNKKLKFPYFKKGGGKKRAYIEEKRPVAGYKSVSKLIKNFKKMFGGTLWIKRFPMGGATVDDIDRYIDSLEAHKGFTPHVIIVDYIGIIEAPKGVTGRDAYDQNTILLKGVGQKRSAAVFTAHQASRKAIEKMSMGQTDVSEEIRVLANVDLMYVINQTEDEKTVDLSMRIGLIAHRHRGFAKSTQVRTLQQLGAGQFALDSKIIDLKPKEEGDDRDKTN